MDPAHKALLRTHRLELSDQLMVSDTIVPFLFQEEILTSGNVEDIEAQATEKRKALRLLDVLPHRGPKAFHCFLQALDDYSWIRDSLTHQLHANTPGLHANTLTHQLHANTPGLHANTLTHQLHANTSPGQHANTLTHQLHANTSPGQHANTLTHQLHANTSPGQHANIHTPGPHANTHTPGQHANTTPGPSTTDEHQFPASLLTKVPSDRNLSRLASRLGAEWESVLVDLGVCAESVYRCRADHTHSTHTAALSGLVQWRQRNGKKATVQRLMDSLQNVGIHTSVMEEVMMT